MPSIWKRNVTVDENGTNLVISNPAQNGPNGPPNPPPLPGKGPRTDTELDITTYDGDRQGGGAKILYHAQNRKVDKGPDVKVELTGITMKDNKPIPPQLTWKLSGGPNAQSGKLLTLTDEGEEGTEYEYFVWGKADDVDKQTADPRITNRGQ